MNEDMYYVNTKSVEFHYQGELIVIENVTWLCFTGNQVYFNDIHKFDMDKMDGDLLISTEQSEEIHPAVKAFVGMFM